MARESNPAAAFWDPSLPLADRTVAGVNDFYKDFQPRLGFAWNPAFDRKLVVHGGYAINSNPGLYNIFSNDATSAAAANAGVVVCTGSNCLPSGGNFSEAAVRAANLPALPRGIDPRPLDRSFVPVDFRPPYTQTYTLAVEHQLGKGAVGELRYTGSLSEKNFQSNNDNPYLIDVKQAFPNYAPVSLCTDPTAPGFGRLRCAYDHEARVCARIAAMQTRGIASRAARAWSGLTPCGRRMQPVSQ